MNNFRYCSLFFRSTSSTFRLHFEKGLFVLLLFSAGSLVAQSMEPETCIKELRKGTLIIRIPTNKTKIDTLTAMVGRSTDPKSKERAQKQLNQAIEERDSLFADYIYAFKNNYDFSAVGYIYDYEARDLNTAHYYNMEEEEIAVADLSEKPLFYVFFERTSDSKIDALVIYNRNLQKIPDPFPNDFSRGGLNTFFLKLSGKKFPVWRVGKINDQLHRYIDKVLAYEKYAEDAAKKKE